MDTFPIIEPRWCRWVPFPWVWICCIWGAAALNMYALVNYEANWFQVTNRSNPPTLILHYGWYETDVVQTSFVLGIVLLVQCTQVFQTIYLMCKYPNFPPSAIRLLYFWTTGCILFSVWLGQEYCNEMFLMAQYYGYVLQPQSALFSFWSAQTCLLIAMLLIG